MSKNKMLVLKDSFEGKVKRLSLHVQDAAVNDNGKEIVSATIFGTLQLFQEDSKKVKNINFSLPLNHNKELRDHLMSIMGEAIKAHEKANKKK